MTKISRKDFLKRAGIGGIGIISGPFIINSLSMLQPQIIKATPNPFDCVLQPVQTGGPFYIDPEYARQDITEGKPGLPMEVRIQVLGVQNCVPVPNAVVNLWHCDHRGVYSEFSTAQGNPEDGTDGTYFRGYQQTNEEGRCSFLTKFPGWYPGRATHLHFDVHLGFDANAAVDTSINPSSTFFSQMYVPDALKTLIYTENEAYEDYGDNPTGLTNDILFNDNQSLMMTFDTSDYPNSLVADFCIGLDIEGTGTSIEQRAGKEYFALEQNAPNPFADSTRIAFNLQKSSFVTLSVVNAAGELVEQLVNRQLAAGPYEVLFDRSHAREELPAGNYLFEMAIRNQHGSFRQSRQMLLID